MMDEMKALLQYAFQTKNPLTLPVSAPGSAGMEMCFVNLVEPGDKVIVCQNGVFGGRMKENVERCGATAIMVEDTWGTAVDPDKLEQALKKVQTQKWSLSYTRNLHGRSVGRQDSGRDRTPPRLPRHRRRRHLAGWLAAQK